VEEVEADGIHLEGGSFLDGVPSGGDIHLLKHVLHNWTDEECVAILRNCERVLNPGGRVLILEHLLCEDDPELAMMDLHMMLVLGGRERTQEQYQALLSQAGMKLVATTPLGKGLPDVLDARRAS
ncbi:MAG: hydroxyneurosporene methyltransferase, partial [Candidatus Eremiobacteraeota bacterium]|nr:hydroxyneurosporene methyltransferase [Candidatus Eremiobacteraeota bacterium]